MFQRRRLGRGGVAGAGVQVDEQAPRVVGVGVESQARAGRVDAYSDDAWRLLVDLHTRAGNPAAAQAAALEHGQVLAELGIEPAASG